MTDQKKKVLYLKFRLFHHQPNLSKIPWFAFGFSITCAMTQETVGVDIMRVPVKEENGGRDSSDSNNFSKHPQI